MTIPFHDTLDAPLDSAEAILARASELVGPAIRPQTWLFFLDADDLQLPLLVPIDETPDPVGGADDLASLARELLTTLLTATDAAAVIAVVERDASSLSDRDRDWARALRDTAVAERVDLRAILFSHAHGVRGLGPDDLG